MGRRLGLLFTRGTGVEILGNKVPGWGHEAWGDQHVHYFRQSCFGMVSGRVHSQKRMQDLWNEEVMTCLR